MWTFARTPHHHKALHIYSFVILPRTLKSWVHGRFGSVAGCGGSSVLPSAKPNIMLICHFPRVARSLKNSLTRISQEMKVTYRKPAFWSPVEDPCGSKAGMATYTAQAFPSWGAEPVREFEGCFLVRPLRKPYVQGRRGSKFWDEILQAPNLPWVISHGHRGCPR